MECDKTIRSVLVWCCVIIIASTGKIQVIQVVCTLNTQGDHPKGAGCVVLCSRHNISAPHLKSMLDSSPEDEDFPGRLLHQSALWDNIELLKDLLEGGQKAFVNSQDSWGRTPLHAAAISENSKCIEILLNAGADSNIKCGPRGDNKTPLHLSAEHGHVNNVSILLQYGASLFERDSSGLTPADLADIAGHTECITLLKNAADEREKSRLDIHAALRDACIKSDVDSVRELLSTLSKDAELIVNMAPSGANTLLFTACQSGNTAIVSLLLTAGGDGRCHPVTRYSPLYIACYHGHVAIVELLLRHFPQLVTQHTVERWLPAHAACIGGQPHVLKLLLEYDYDKGNPQCTDNTQDSKQLPPSGVLRRYRDESGEWEYQMAFDVNERDASGQTVLYVACVLGNLGLVDVLLGWRVKATRIQQFEDVTPSSETNSIITPTKRRISDGIQSIMSKLSLSRDNSTESSPPPSDPDSTVLNPIRVDLYCNNSSETALHAAVKGKHYEIVHALILAKANPNLVIKTYVDYNESISCYSIEDDLTSGSSTALVEACRNRDVPLVDLLLKYGGRDDDCKALSITVQNKDDVLTAKLLSMKANPDPEYKINKKSMTEGHSSQLSLFSNSGGGGGGGGGLTYSTIFPNTPAMINWHNQRCQLSQLRTQWLVDAALQLNPKLRQNPRNCQVALYAITRLDISNNTLTSLPPDIFQLHSLRYLNLSQNRITALPKPPPNSNPNKHKSHLHHRGGNSRFRRHHHTSSTPKSPTSEDLTSTTTGRESSLIGGYTCPVLEELYLQENRLEEIPPELFQLPALVTLVIANNKLQELPYQMWLAPKLKELNASFNLLRELPHMPVENDKEELDGLSISSSDSQLSSHTEASDSEIPPDIDLDPDMDGTKTVRYRKKDRSLIQLDITKHHIWTHSLEVTEQIHHPLPPDDTSLSSSSSSTTTPHSSPLSSLHLAHNLFTAIPPALPCLAVHLTRLNLAFNSLRSMGHVTSYPTALKQLDLNHNEVSCWPSLPPQVDPLDVREVASTACYASGGGAGREKMCMMAPPVAVRRQSGKSVRNTVLHSVCLHRRHLRLDNLRTLILADNKFTRIQLATDDDGDNFTNIEEDEQDRGVVSGKAKLIFPNLSMLDISNNTLKEIPQNIFELSNLSVLNISGNLDINELPSQMGLLSRLWNLNTRGCGLQEPLKSMIDSKKYKTMDIIGYLKSVLEDAKPYARMKLMIVGVQGIGKTSLLEQLRQEGVTRRKPEHWAKRMGNKNINSKTSRGTNISTVGVDIGDWVYEKKIRNQSSHGPVIFRTWDFGGQKEYYATHQYFLSRRSLYLVVWKIPDGARGIDEILQWLVNIQARAPNSPVLIVGTHYDVLQESGGTSEHYQQLIRERFINIVDAEKCGLPRVLDTIEISSRTRHNVRLLCSLIYDTVFSLIPAGSKELLLEQKVPATYLALEDVVIGIAAERRQNGMDPVLNADEYRSIVVTEMQQRYGRTFRDLAELHQATLFLHDNGVLLHYDDATLKDLYFLDPQWLCDMLAHVVTIREINPFARNGIMKLDDLKHIFKASNLNSSNTTLDTRGYIVNLLNKFEVALTWDSRTLLIPSLLPAEEDIQMAQLYPGQYHPMVKVRVPLRSRGWAVRGLGKKVAAGKGGYGGGRDHSAPGRFTMSMPSGMVTSAGKEEVVEPPPRFQITSTPTHQSITRLLLMSYFPSGFWSRLMSRVLGDDTIVDIIRSFFVLPKEAAQDGQLVRLLDFRAEWELWQTGLQLKYNDITLFRMREVLQGAGSQYRQLQFRLKQEGLWCDVDLHSTSILELHFPVESLLIKPLLYDHLVTSINSITTPTNPTSTSTNPSSTSFSNPNSTPTNPTSNSSSFSNPPSSSSYHLTTPLTIPCTPESTAQLLSLAVDHIDILLEDWYPTLGTRFVHTSEGRFLVTRLVPCPRCLGTLGPAGEQALYSFPGEPTPKAAATLEVDDIEAIRNRLRKSQESYTSECDSGVGPDSTSSSRMNSMEGHPALLGNSLMEESLVQGNPQQQQPIYYSWMVEECILAAYTTKAVQCPSHGDIGLREIAPDTIFLDLGDRHLIKPEHIKKGRLLGRGAFGFVFKGTYLRTPANNTTSHQQQTDVAMKMLQPVQPGPQARPSALLAYRAAQGKWDRDPLQYACKAYCTARQELNILLALRHPNIVPFVGVCTSPLALVLDLAPQGALDLVLRHYRRSGAKLGVYTLQGVILQVAKAVEYLHRQHIIYRDLKSENVLVWEMPPPFVDHPDQPVHIKVADYGISRQTLPSGTKGFGGTEGFMAPEIMRYNGEEEYTEKVDCFSFGMFMYELLTLHQPFEGHESVKECILEGGRPPLTYRETLYPSYFLDLMVLCWSQQPKDRPSASQIVSIASAPEFTHLSDIMSLKHQAAVVSATSAPISYITDDGLSGSELWLMSANSRIDLLLAADRGWLQYHSMGVPIRPTCTCTVGPTVWIGDFVGKVHAYSVTDGYKIFSYTLETDGSTAVQSLLYLPALKRVACALANGRLFLLNSEVVPRTPSSAEGTFVMTELGSSSVINCLCALYTDNGRVCEIWCGQSLGQISVYSIRDHVVTGHELLNHYQPPIEHVDVINVVSSTTTTTEGAVWSYVRPGCIVYQWDQASRSIVHKLDCSKLVPCSESLKSIAIEEHLSPTNCQVTALAILHDSLYIGTTWGCVIVAERASLRPVTVFRPYEDEVRQIIPLTRSKSSVEHQQQYLQQQQQSHQQQYQQQRQQQHSNVPLIATIGRGYRSLPSRYVDVAVGATSSHLLPSPAGVQQQQVLGPASGGGGMFVLLWRAEHWNAL